ncbi:23S rRNA (pseudouridine(1915)-N(3))-methyltransferase RlmH [uncultured Prochlorococcus sp.]|jgi:23S rRNA (pseudouridine1915-N3)-methyltransferase|uniref:23S rRNA (pseudouridine(1915)-N(3))-methyltransferase RlmH n=1 Tax=Prochlorococcus sp. TaxID=1220 RepID=UPI0025839A94|nr:23S rRNA (pseudouridine(1915)-N(3))-methyltransferase RlmH [uncultured Prochlorococcus sp.]
MLQTNRLSIIAIGKIKKNWIREGINQYKKRMPDLIINESKSFNIDNIRVNNNIIICLTEEGQSFNSIELTSLLLNFKNKKINFLIGDADGIPSDIKDKSNLLLSLSPLTFPHELARLILIEQIYRAISISNNSPYHRA